MKFRKVVSLFAAAAMAVSSFAGLATTASAATANDIVPISSTSTYWFDDYVSAATAAGDLFADNHFFSVKGGSSWSTSKGKHGEHSNCLSLKNNSRMMQFSISKPAEVTIYAQAHDSRGVVVSTTLPTGSYSTQIDALADANNYGVIAAQTVSEDTITFTTDAATDLFLSSYNGDIYVAGVSVTIQTTEPTINVSPTSKTLVIGESVELSATTENADGAEIVWTSDDEGVATVENGLVSAVSEGSATITAMVNVDGTEYSASCEITVVNTGTVSFTATGAEGSAPTAITANIGEEITLPLNKTLYVAGSTLVGWSDGEDIYAPGGSYTVSGDATLTAVFEENTVELGDAEATVVFWFGKSNGAPTYALQNKTGILVAQADINGTAVDVKLDINTTPGKFSNTSSNGDRTDQWVQCNTGTTLSIPVIEGSVVTVGDVYNNNGEYTLGGVACVGDSGTYTATKEGTVDFVATGVKDDTADKSVGYLDGITVTYPKVESSGDEGDSDTTQAVTLKYPSSAINEGDPQADTAEYLFKDGVDANLASFFADPSDSTKLDTKLTSGYKNYIQGTNTGYGEPYITADLPAGTYKLYYLGLNHGKEVNATIASTGETVYDTSRGVEFAYDSNDTSKVLKLYTLEFTLDKAVKGETISFDSTQDSWLPDLYAVVITNQEVAPKIETVTNVIPAKEMTPIGNSGGTPHLYQNQAPGEATAEYAKYQDIFGENFSKAGVDKYGYLGDTSRGHVETTFTTTADGPCTLYVLASYHRNGNRITVTDSNSNAIVDSVTPAKSEKVGTNGQDLFVYTVSIPNLQTGTYTFKWHAADQCSDLVALGITYAVSAEAPDLTDVMPDFAYQFCNTNSTELTSTTSGTYILDKDGKLQDVASNQTVTLKNVRYHNDHGLSSSDGATYTFRAQAPFKLTVGTCAFDDGSGKLVVKDLNGNTLYDSGEVVFPDNCYIGNPANVVEFSYTGTEVVDVVFSTPKGCYFPYLAKTSIETNTLSGALTGAEGLNEGVLTFTSQTTGNVYNATISNGTYSVVVPAGDTYDVLLFSSSYVATTTYTANGDNDSANINCSAAAYQTVSGTIVNAPAEDTTLTFTGANSGYVVTANIAAGATSYTTSLMPDVYTVSSSTGTLSKLSAESFMVVNVAVTKNLYYPETIPNATATTVTVYKDQPVSGTNYHTISDAITGLKNGKIANPTILLKSGETYQEQVRVQNLNGLTLKTDGEAKATITWYYGIGYTYYSLGADGYYDKDRAMTKVGKLERSPDRWGAVVRVQSDNFTAENIIFENSFNQRYTEEEVADGVMYNGLEAITVDRVNQTVVVEGKTQTVAADSRKATERAAAIAIEGKGVELYNCEFISSQDTFFTGGTAYVKNCAITGNTDYIFGGGSIVFDDCDLIWGGYSDQEAGGHITASNGSDAGYLFRDCTIKDGNRVKAAGTFGRDWGGEKDSHTYFINCTDATEKGVSGWANMGGAVNAGTADLHVFDLSDPASYASYGKTDKYNITEFTFADAVAKYEGAFDTIGFTPSKGTNAETTTKALDGKEDTVKEDYVYGVLTTITAGTDATVSGITWIITDANGSAYERSTSAEVDNVTTLNKGTFPTITGGGEATVFMLFHADKGTYDVASQAN